MPKEEQQAKIRKRMKVIRSEQEWSNADIANLLKVKHITVKNKFIGACNWTLDDIFAVAEITGYSMDYVCGRSDNKFFFRKVWCQNKVNESRKILCKIPKKEST